MRLAMHAAALGAALYLLGCAGDTAGSGRADDTEQDSAAGAGRDGSFGNSDQTADTDADGATPADPPPGSAPAPNPAGSALPAPNIDSILDRSCASATIQSQLLPTHILFVLDRSGSMNCNPPPTTESAACEGDPVRADTALPSKWEITRDALEQAIEALPDDTSLGIAYFSNDDTCGVSSAPSVDVRALDQTQRSALGASLAQVEPRGGTPLVGATVLAYKHMHGAAVDGELLGNKFVVLLTDGEQSERCFDEDHCADAASCTSFLLDDQVPTAAMSGVDIRTFAIGAPGSEPARSVLSEIALSGGTATDGCDVEAGDCHFDMTREPDFAQALTDALTSITGEALTCELPVPSDEDGDEELDLGLVNVIYSPAGGGEPRVLPKDDRLPCDGGADGWQYADGNRKIRLCGEICTSVRDDAGGRVDVVLGCPVAVPE